MKKKIIGITMGDAAGIGPEIIVKALNKDDLFRICQPIVIGDAKILERTILIVKEDIKINIIKRVDEAKNKNGYIDIIDLDLLPPDIVFGEVSGIAGHAAYKYIEKAVQLAKEKEIDAICTAPLNKEALHKGGHVYPGHTEILAELTQTEDFSMMLTAPHLKVIHLTTHVGLVEAIKCINPERTHKVITLAHELLSMAGINKPKIGVCGINPHAGENGLFGNNEEEEKLIPGIRRCQKEGIDVSGPYPADSLFFRARKGDFDIVVACYHDQGHIPIKIMGIEEGVNITVGLKGGIIRTSVDHGTAFDIAGQNVADSRSILAAIKSAVELAPAESI